MKKVPLLVIGAILMIAVVGAAASDKIATPYEHAFDMSRMIALGQHFDCSHQVTPEEEQVFMSNGVTPYGECIQQGSLTNLFNRPLSF